MMPLKMTSAVEGRRPASYVIGVYSNRNLCFVAGRSTILNCLNRFFSMPEIAHEVDLRADDAEATRW